MEDKYFQKCIVCGGLILSLSIPICKKCLAVLPPDLPVNERPTRISFSVHSISVLGTASGTASTTTITMQLPYIEQHTLPTKKLGE